MKLAHLSDLHILDVTGARPRQFLNKRLLGGANLLTARAGAHPTSILERAVADVVGERPDHVALTGDLTNLALESEFRRARELLAPLATRQLLSLVPGNHDAYTRDSVQAGLFQRYFGDLLWDEGEPARFPWLKRVGELTLIGLRSVMPVGWLLAHGRVGDEQLERFRSLADTPGFKVVLLHHNLHSRGWRRDRMHGLRDRAEVLRACAECGVDLILHGHTHVAHRFEHAGIPVIGCGSSTRRSDNPDHVARYNLYEIDDGELVRVRVRVYHPETDRFHEGTVARRQPGAA